MVLDDIDERRGKKPHDVSDIAQQSGLGCDGAPAPLRMAADNARGWWHRAARLGDTGSGSGRHFWVAQGSPDVFINGRAALRAGDSYDAPGCVLAQGSATVFINGRAAGRFGDAISGGGDHITGSPTVLISDRHPDAKADPGSDPQGMAFAEAGG